MTSAGYVLSAWGVVLGSGAVYALWLMLRGRRLSRKVEPSRRRWMTAAPAESNACVAESAAAHQPGSGHASGRRAAGNAATPDAGHAREPGPVEGSRDAR